jgi:hypothetical protein
MTLKILMSALARPFVLLSVCVASGPGIAALEKMIKKLIDEPVTKTDAATRETSDTDKKSP